MAKLITLAKRLDFTTEMDYFDYCIDSYTNGNFSQCKELFKAMSKADRKSLLNHIGTGINMKDVYQFYFNLL